MVIASSVAFASPSSENKALTQALQNQPQVEVVNDSVNVPSQNQTTSQSLSNSTTVQQPVILQNRPTNTIQQPTIVIQKQPQTVVEDSPLTESTADRLRRQRLEAEQQTESKIVERLEQERIRAEQERASKVLGALDKKDEEPKKEEVVAPVAAAAAVAAPVAADQAVSQQGVVVAPNAQKVDQPQTVVVQHAQEITNNTAEQKPAPAIESKVELAKLDQPEEKKNRVYVGPNFGFVAYPSLNNVRTSGALGFTVGSTFDDKFDLEGSFLYSKSQIEDVFRPGVYDVYHNVYYPTFEDMKQYTVSGTFKYNIFGNSQKFSPHIGGTLAYIYRDYKDTQQFDSARALEGTSWAINTGLLVGADLKLSDNVSLGADLSYLFNITYQVHTSSGLEPSKIMYNDGNGQPIEAVSFYNFLINLKYTF